MWKNMPLKLPEHMKSLVIQQWLQGVPRNDIAAQNGLSSGAVTNIVNEWRRNLGDRIADELRHLATTLRNVGITASQCALGFRLASIMLRIGVNEGDFESFILDVYNRCKDIGFSPESISSYIKDLVQFSTNGVPASKIADYLNEKSEEKRKLEEEIQRLNLQIAALKQEEKNCQTNRDKALREKQTTIEILNWYSNLKQELIKYSIPIEDLSEFARLLNNIRQHSRYDVDKVINEFWSLEMLRSNHNALQKDVASLKNLVGILEGQRSTLEVYVNMQNQTISTYNDLKAMGFGLNDLNFLFDTINEIASENDIPIAKAVRKFLSDVEEQYDRKVGFEHKLQDMRDEVNKLRKEQVKVRTETLSYPLLGPRLLTLIQRGLSDQDIINVADIIEKFSPLADAVIDGKPDVQSLASDLNKYSNIKSAIQALTSDVDSLKKEAGHLMSQNQDLKQENLRMFSSSINICRTVDFFQGAAFSLRNEIMNLVLTYLYITRHLFKSPLREGQKLQSADQFSNEFEALSRSKSGEDVPLEEIEQDVIKAINVLLNKIGPSNDKLAAALLVARNALRE
jgi:hypothetical protein